MKILVAEDTPTQAAMIKLGLKRLGHDVILARDGIEAIEKAYQDQPELIVSDVVMPRLNGYQVCRLLKDDRQTSCIPVVLLTSLDQKQDMFWGLKSGADKFITKGGDIPDLVKKIQMFLEEWYSTRPPCKKTAREMSTGVDFDVMGRVIKLLDRNLFESTVTNEIQNLVHTLDDYEKTIISVLEILSKVIDFHVGCICLVDEDREEFYYFINRSVDEGYIGNVKKSVLARIAEEDSGDRGAIDVEEVFFDPHNLLKVPGKHPKEFGSSKNASLRNKGNLSGIIFLALADTGALAERTAQTFDIISRQANIVIDYARLYERNKQLSITDGLTKIYNHRYFQEQLLKEFSRSTRHKASLSLIMMDIDHFKRFNDTYGHQQGDIVLKELARLLQALVRNCDILARYGGEEFAVIMPAADANIAATVAERLRVAVEQHAIPGQDEELSVTISMGIATIPSADIATSTELITVADQALYKAKEQGRNRVVW